MIGLIGVLPPPGDGAGTMGLDALPEPPASPFSGVAVCSADGAGVAEALRWYRKVRDARPAVAFDLVCDPEMCAEHLAGLPYALTFLLRPGDLVADGLPGEALGQVRQAGVEGRIFDEAVERYGEEVLEQEETLRALIARACCGGSVGRAARDLGVSSKTVRRRLHAAGIPAAGELRTWVRLRGFEVRVQLGVDRTEALKAAGWRNQEQRRKAVARVT